MVNLKEPVALQVYKHNRWCTVAKLTKLKGKDKWVLAIIYRNTPNLDGVFSVPKEVVEVAKRLGVTELYYVNERMNEFGKVHLLKFIADGFVIGNEIYFRTENLQKLKEKPKWEYATKTVKVLTKNTPIEEVQSSLA